LQRVVDRRFEIRLRAVVVDAQAAADVEILDAGADAVQLAINARRFGEGALDVADIGDLAAEVEVDELQAILHAALLEVIERLERFGQRQAELGAEARAVAPAARAA